MLPALPVSVGWRLRGREGVLVFRGGLGLMFQRRLPAFCAVSEGFRHAVKDMQPVLGCGGRAEVNSLGMERIGQHSFPCVLRPPSPSWPELTVLHGVLAGPADQVLEGGPRAGPVPQLSQLCMGPALQPQSSGGPVGLGVGVGVGMGFCGGFGNLAAAVGLASMSPRIPAS